MGLPLYLAMTAPEISGTLQLPPHLAYMACHFSSYSTGLSNVPQNLPPGSMLILNDRTPVQGHDPELIGLQLSEISAQLQAACILLDFQRPVNDLTSQVAEAIMKQVSCPVAISEGYAKEIDCSVFLSSPTVNVPLEEYIHPWKGREIWLEAALDEKVITLDRSGSRLDPADACLGPLPHRDEKLFCHYKIEPEQEQVRFILRRTADDLKALLQKAEELGVAGAVGLYQELGSELHF